MRLTGRIIILATGGTVGLAAYVIASHPQLIRVVAAVTILITLALVSLRKPQAALILTLAFLLGLGMLRRVLIPVAGWTSYDALLLVGPLMSFVFVHRLFVMERRPLAKEGFSKMVLALLMIAVLEIFNPMAGSVQAGLTGLLFLGAPLVWFFIGRELADTRV